MRKRLPLAIVTLFSSVALAGGQAQVQSQRDQEPPAHGAKRVDLVIALDTSSSMDGLIDAARAKLWDVVNLLAHARPQPVLRVGLISYGNDGYDARAGWVRKEVELTTNLDDVYDKLFALRTNELQKRIAELSRKRDAFIQGERNKQAANGPKAFDDAVTSSIRTEAESAGFAF